MNNLVFLRRGSNKKLNLFLIHAGNGEVQPYVLFTSLLSKEFNCWGLRANRFDDYTPVNRSINSMAKNYLKQIRSVQLSGPYYLAGWCFGGVRAYEITSQLEQSGEKVNFLALFNPTPPILKNMERKKMVTEYSLLNPNPYNISKRVKFTFNSEKLLILKWLNVVSVKKFSLNNFDNKKKLWMSFAKEFDKVEFQNKFIKEIKKYIPKDRGEAIPYFESITFRNLIYYLNVMRTDANAQAFYFPKSRLQTKITFFEAKETLVKRKNDWNLFTLKPVLFNKINGDHFSIFDEGNVQSFANKFNKFLIKSIK